MTIKVAISYRVLQAWRVPVFERLAKVPGLQVKVFYGEDFSGSKVKSYQGKIGFDAVRLKTYRVSFGTRNGRAYIPVNIGIWSELTSYNPDVIITEGASNLFNNLVCFVYAKVRKKKIIQWGLGELRGRKLSIQRKFVNLIFDIVEKKSDAAIAYSSLGVEYYKRIGIEPSKIFRAVNVVDTEARIDSLKDYCDENGLIYPSPVPGIFNVLYVGTLSENKNVDLLVRAFGRFIGDGKVARLTIVGDGIAKADLGNLVENLGLLSSVEFAGHVGEGIAKYFYDASVFVLPGLGGLAVSDALCHGVPVICGIGDGCELDLIDGTNGRVIDLVTEDNLLDELETIYAKPKELASLRHNASRVICDKYNISKYVSAIEFAVREVSDA